MSYRMLVTTFKNDVKQFQMFCHTLAKNWQGTRDLIVCLGYGDDIEFFKQITDSTFDHTWTVTIKPTVYVKPPIEGSTEQQVNTVFHSITSGVEDIIVWDCKDFILRPCNFSMFKRNDRYRVTYLIPGKKLVDMNYPVHGLVDVPIDHIPAISNIRPWIWNVKQLHRYWVALVKRFGDYHTWDHYPAGNEIYGYLIYTLTDPKRTIKFLTHPDMPLMFAGGYTHQTYEAMIKDVTEFDQETDRIVWKHSRKLEDPRCLDVTKSMLIKYDIDPEFVKQVYG